MAAGLTAVFWPRLGPVSAPSAVNIGPADAGAAVQVLYPSYTVAAYNTHGGRSLYVATPAQRVRDALGHIASGDAGAAWRSLRVASAGRARAVSLSRPENGTHARFHAAFFASLARQDTLRYGVLRDEDLDAALPPSMRVLVVAGHSEYWTRAARRAADAFVARGGHLVVLSGNTAWWQARREGDSLVVVRVWDADARAPDSLRTVTWGDPRLGYPIEPSFGAAFPYGGYGDGEDAGWDGFRILEPRSPLLGGVVLRADSVVRVVTREFDGVPVRWTGGAWGRGRPLVLAGPLGVARAELVGYDLGQRFGRPTLGALAVTQRTPTSGIVVHAGSTDWCGDRGWNGPDSLAIRQITRNALRRLLRGEPVFSR